jgi:hypothetical protein
MIGEYEELLANPDEEIKHFEDMANRHEAHAQEIRAYVAERIKQRAATGKE